MFFFFFSFVREFVSALFADVLFVFSFLPFFRYFQNSLFDSEEAWQVRGVCLSVVISILPAERKEWIIEKMPAGDSWERQLSMQSTWNNCGPGITLFPSSLFSLGSRLVAPSLWFSLLRGEADRETLSAHFSPRREWARFTQRAPAPNLGSWYLMGLEKSPHLKLRHGKRKAGGDVVASRAGQPGVLPHPSKL